MLFKLIRGVEEGDDPDGGHLIGNNNDKKDSNSTSSLRHHSHQMFPQLPSLTSPFYCVHLKFVP